MQEIKAGAVTLCVFLVVSGVILFLSPKDGCERPFKFLVSLMSVTVIISAVFMNFDFDLDKVDFPEYDAVSVTAESVRKTYLNATEKRVRKLISQALEVAGTDDAEINMDMNINEDNSISINKITVILNEADGAKSDWIYQLLRTNIGGNVEVKTAEVNKNER